MIYEKRKNIVNRKKEQSSYFTNYYNIEITLNMYILIKFDVSTAMKLSPPINQDK